MLFRSRYIVRPFGLGQTPEILEIERTEPPQLKLTLRPIQDDEVKQFYDKDDWVAVVLIEELISDKVTADFERSEAEPSQAVREVTARASKRGHALLEGFLRLARWRNAVFGDHRLIRCIEGGWEWSSDGTAWKSARDRLTASVVMDLQAVRYEPSLFDQIRDMLLAEVHEPVGHELLREAWNLKYESPRSALILGVAALEVGAKEFIAKLVPGSEWLCFELPAPPVVKMLEEYLPRLPVKLQIGGRAFVPDKILEVLRNAVTSRNRVAHKGTIAPSTESLASMLTNIQMCLYLLDYYEGHAWAANKMRDAEISDLVRRGATQPAPI